ncbi:MULTISPECIES: septum formation family protein [unclassified Salinibacterium]|uniref:septum formation family protein n=1 Tax=unclassified Salinibacterium TaxID=2632331 RepID=UPI0014229C4A|nr:MULTISPECIES: septum formation family protein [unclassified Salinibacterium]
MSPTLKTVSVAMITLVALTLSGCSLVGGLFPGDAVRDSDGQITERNDNTDVFSIRVGDCTNDVEAEEIAAIPTVPCSEPHDNEAYFAYEIEAEEFPGDEALLAEAGDACVAEFEDFAGIAYDESMLGVGPLVPSESTWAEGDREVVCFIFALDEDFAPTQSTGTLKGAAI